MCDIITGGIMMLAIVAALALGGSIMTDAGRAFLEWYNPGRYYRAPNQQVVPWWV